MSHWFIKKSFLTSLLGLALLCSACSGHRPRPRMGSYATSTPGTNFIDATRLGNHRYALDLFETNGILYTCHGGHIDIAHLRIAADHVYYLHTEIYQHLMRSDRKMTFKLNVDRSRFYAEFSYPPDWDKLDDEQTDRIARQVALQLAQHFTFTMVNWHEVLTFYGFKSMGLVSEFPSAFSWEDTYSNTLGVYLGARAVRFDDLTYDEAMTRLLNEAMESLNAQPASMARAAAEQMRGVWFDGDLSVTMHVRNTDIGLADGLIWPMLVPGVCEAAEPRPYPAPRLDALDRYGFGLTLEVEPREFEKNRILRIVYPDGGPKRLDIDRHLPVIMVAIEHQIIEAGGMAFRDGVFFGAAAASEAGCAGQETAEVE